MGSNKPAFKSVLGGSRSLRIPPLSLPEFMGPTKTNKSRLFATTNWYSQKANQTSSPETLLVPPIFLLVPKKVIMWNKTSCFCLLFFRPKLVKFGPREADLLVPSTRRSFGASPTTPAETSARLPRGSSRGFPDSAERSHGVEHAGAKLRRQGMNIGIPLKEATRKG